MFFDHELGFPVRYETYGWPAKTGEEPPLIKEYTFADVKLDQGLTDADFDIANPAYHFPPAR